MTVGAVVKVVRLVDQYGDESKIGKLGVVNELINGENRRAGVGESANDPFIVVRFPNGQHDGFWTEELEAQP